jgi:serine/threonine protein kinase
LHRDIKPSNIFLTKVGNETVAKIGDFGLSYQLKNASRASARAGTTVYWSPGNIFCSLLLLLFFGKNLFFPPSFQEIFAGENPSKQSDVYALGCCFYELMMGDHRPASALLITDKRASLLEDMKQFYQATLAQMVTEMVAQDVQRRPSFQELERRLRAL